MTDRIRTKRKKDGLVQSSNLLEGGKQSVAFPGNSLTATKNGHDFSNLGDQNKSKGIDDFEVFLERVAHDIVYHDSLTPQDKEFLRTMGYQANPSAILYGKHGLQFLALHVVRENHNLKPILAFRGTDFSLNFREVIADWKTNLGLQQTEGLDQIGEAQFHSNQALIEKIIDGFSEKVIVTGHSLGGALAQITACAYPDRVSRIVTFQSPGINKEGVQKLNDHNKESKPNEMIDSTHYRVKGDIPHNFGEAMTPGSIYEFVVEGGDPHGAFPLRSSKFVPASVRRKSPINTSEEVREPAYEAARRTIPDFSIPTSREDFLVDGVKQGVSGLYKTLNNSMEWAITGDPTKLLEQYDRQRKGESGAILQGWTMVADSIEAIVTGDMSYFGQIANQAEWGKLGMLPALGANLDDRALMPLRMPFDALQNITEGITDSSRSLLKQEEAGECGPAKFTDPTRKLRGVMPRR